MLGSLSSALRLLVWLVILLSVLLDVAASNYHDPDMHAHADTCEENYIPRKINVTERLSGYIWSPRFARMCEKDVKMEVEFSGKYNGEGGEVGPKYRVQLDIFNMTLGYDKEDSEVGRYSHSATHCDHSDYIKVWVSVEDSRREIASLCGSNKPQKMMSSNSLMWMEFVRRGETDLIGHTFNASYNFVTNFGIHTGLQIKDHEKECMFEFYSSTAKNGTFTSPNYPGLYPRNTECYYIFKGTKAERIIITFIDFNVEGANNCDDGSQSDYVEFSNFNIGLVDRKMDRFCGSNLLKNEVQSDGSFFRVTFISNNAYDSTGFDAHYQFKTIEEQQPQVQLDRVQAPSNSAETARLLSFIPFFLSILPSILFF